MTGLIVISWLALWLIPYVFLARSVLREVQTLPGHVIPAFIFGGLLAPVLLAAGHGIAPVPVAFACADWLTEAASRPVVELLLYLVYWAIATAILTTITYSLRKKGSEVKGSVDHSNSTNPFD